MAEGSKWIAIVDDLSLEALWSAHSRLENRLLESNEELKWVNCEIRLELQSLCLGTETVINPERRHRIQNWVEGLEQRRQIYRGNPLSDTNDKSVRKGKNNEGFSHLIQMGTRTLTVCDRMGAGTCVKTKENSDWGCTSVSLMAICTLKIIWSENNPWTTSSILWKSNLKMRYAW